MRSALLALPTDAPVRLRKPTSNLFRPRTGPSSPLDATGFDGLIALDAERRTADVLGMTTYEHLVDATLPHGLMPLVVPQLKTITLGGAVTGLGIESTSFRSGCPHESVLEMDVLTGAGDIVTATPDNEHRDLFYGFPNSYGSLGYALRLKIELEPVSPYVRLRHVRFGDAGACTAAIEQICAESSYDGQRVDFLDGTWFGHDEVYLTLGSWTGDAPATSDYTGRDIYYKSIREKSADWLTVRDYLWRWDTDWFWCSRAFGAQNPTLRALWPKSKLRSDVFWKLVSLERRYGIKAAIDRRRGKPEIEYVIQDVEIPVGRTPEFLGFLHQQTGMEPVWLCPLRQRDPAARWTLYPLNPDETYVNVGFWGGVDLPRGEHEPFHNRAIEKAVADLGGRKSLYSTAFYPEDEFWDNYGGPDYEVLKKTYDPDGRLLDLYSKTVNRR
ncbi:MAG TPA: FAD-binding oxidoreductase [Mycobacteriales bacterium]|jgi:FAD/FMN-containing dehydrogenase|nr:FAD-binding oxidoreductase [Mycobacteriales bacterium]